MANNNNSTNNYEFVNHPSHYNKYDMETIDMMIKLWGIQNTITFCKMNAFKYRMRMGNKPDNSIKQDLQKEQWYLNKANELSQQLSTLTTPNTDGTVPFISDPDNVRIVPCDIVQNESSNPYKEYYGN